MALKKTELFNSTSRAATLRFVPANDAIQPKEFATGSTTLVPGLPVARNSSTGKWVVWANAGANETNIIRGFIWPDDVVLDASDEVLGNLMLGGTLHRDDVVIPGGETQGNLDIALASGLRERGFIVQGLETFR